MSGVTFRDLPTDPGPPATAIESTADANIGSIFGIGFPAWTGGVLQYIDNYADGFVANGPFNVLATFHVDTGYFRDRLLPGITFVYDFNSGSGAILPELQYRFTENFSATISMNLFNGRFQQATPALRSIADYPFRAGNQQNSDWTEQGLAPVRDMDEVALRIRYTF